MIRSNPPPKSTSYFPLVEILTFLLAVALTIVALRLAGRNSWLALLGTLMLYSIIMKDACYIKLGPTTLLIWSFNPFIGKHSIPWASLNKISSHETVDDESYEVTPIPVVKRRYNLQYTASNKQHVVPISFSNTHKQNLILSIIAQNIQGRDPS